MDERAGSAIPDSVFAATDASEVPLSDTRGRP